MHEFDYIYKKKDLLHYFILNKKIKIKKVKLKILIQTNFKPCVEWWLGPKHGVG